MSATRPTPLRLALTAAAVLAGTVLLAPAAGAGNLAPTPAPEPAVTGTLEVTCTQDIPVPTVVVTATNPTAWPQSVDLLRNGLTHTGLVVDAGSDEHEVIPEVAWEDKDNHFQLVSNGTVLAEVHHHFDCLHPIISVDIASVCADAPVPVIVTNSGHEGTHVTVTVDGAVVAEPPVAPGHHTQVDVTADPGSTLAVHHQGDLEAHADLIACDTAPAPTPPGDDDRPDRRPGDGDPAATLLTHHVNILVEPGAVDDAPTPPHGPSDLARAAHDVAELLARHLDILVDLGHLDAVPPTPEPSAAPAPERPEDTRRGPGGPAVLLAGLAPVAVAGVRRALG
jgi:hypothetical protein